MSGLAGTAIGDLITDDPATAVWTGAGSDPPNSDDPANWSFAATEPMSAVSGGVDIVSAGSDAPSATTVALETRYRTTDFSNFINMITEKIKGFLLIVK